MPAMRFTRMLPLWRSSAKRSFSLASKRTDFWRDLVGPDTNVVDVDGRTVIPGLIDSHTHPEMVV